MNSTMKTIVIGLAVLLIAGVIIGGSFVLFPSTQATLPSAPMQNALATPTQPQEINSQAGSPEATFTPTPTLALPIATFTLIPTANVEPSILVTQMPNFSSVTEVQEQEMPDGLYLTLPGGYRVGPLARGAYSMGPNGRYFIYVSNAGQVYALRLGEAYFVRIQNLKRVLQACIKNVDPAYRLSFYDNGIRTALIVEEDYYRQSVAVPLPRSISH